MGRKERMQKKALEQQAILDAAKGEGRGLTAEEEAQFNSLQREIDVLRNERDIEGDSGEGNAPTEPAGDDQQRHIQEERTRISEVSELCREFGMEDNLGDYIKDGTSAEQVRAAVIEHMRNGGQPIPQRVVVGEDEQDKFRAAATDGLMMRAGVQVGKASAGATEFRGLSLRDLAIECLTREGKNANELIRMNKDELYSNLSRQFYNPTSAFPAILDATIKKSVVKIYEQVPTTFQAWTQKGSLNDFKATSDQEYVIGGTGEFIKVAENGELKSDKPKDQKLPSRKLDTYGRQFSMSRQAFINDDIGFLTEIPGLYATSAKRTIDKQVYTLLYKNAKTFDGKTLFGADHKNVMAAASKPTQASIQAMILQMQKQTDPFGEAIYMTPQSIIVGVGYEFDLSVILNSTQVTGSSNNDVNPLYNYPLQIVQTPVLNALAGTAACPWFISANPLSAKGIQVDYLNGQEIPTIRRMETAGTLGFTWDIFLDWGISVRDYRGLIKNPGAKIV